MNVVRTMLVFSGTVLASTLAEAETIELWSPPNGAEVDAQVLVTSNRVWLTRRYSASGFLQSDWIETDGTKAGTRLRSAPESRLRLVGSSADMPLYVGFSGAESLCVLSSSGPQCASPRPTTEPGQSDSARLDPTVLQALPFGTGALFYGTTKFTRNQVGGDRVLGQIGLFAPPSTTSVVQILAPGGIPTPFVQAALLGIVGSTALFQRSDTPLALWRYDGATQSSRTTTQTFSYVPSLKGASWALAFGSGGIYTLDTQSDLNLGPAEASPRTTVFGSRIALTTIRSGTPEVWITDGTLTGTAKFPLPLTQTFGLLASANRVYVAGISGNGPMSVWSIDGLGAPTLAFTCTSQNDVPSLLGSRGGAMYFAVNNSAVTPQVSQIFKSDGTNTQNIGSVPGAVFGVEDIQMVSPRSPTLRDTVIARLGTKEGLLFIRGDALPNDAGADAQSPNDAGGDTPAPNDAGTIQDAGLIAQDASPNDSSPPQEGAVETGCACNGVHGAGSSLPFPVLLAFLFARRLQRQVARRR